MAIKSRNPAFFHCRQCVHGARPGRLAPRKHFHHHGLVEIGDRNEEPLNGVSFTLSIKCGRGSE
jgi:hypothetical protein